MSRSLPFSGVEFLITGSVQKETEWPPVKGTAGEVERLVALVTSTDFPTPRFYNGATGVGHYRIHIYGTIHQHVIPNSLPHGVRGGSCQPEVGLC
jgi:hypothetical protein